MYMSEYFVNAWDIEINLPRQVMQRLYVYFLVCVMDNNVVFLRILSHTIKQNVIILRRLVGEISHFQFDPYRVILTEASDLNLFVGSVHLSLNELETFTSKIIFKISHGPGNYPRKYIPVGSEICCHNVGPSAIRKPRRIPLSPRSPTWRRYNMETLSVWLATATVEVCERIWHYDTVAIYVYLYDKH